MKNEDFNLILNDIRKNNERFTISIGKFDVDEITACFTPAYNSATITINKFSLLSDNVIVMKARYYRFKFGDDFSEYLKSNEEITLNINDATESGYIGSRYFTVDDVDFINTSIPYLQPLDPKANSLKLFVINDDIV